MFQAFIHSYDFVLLRNGENVEGATHKHVVNLIKKGGDKLTLVVISVSQQEAEKLDSESSSGGEYYDYSDKRAVPLSIPETRQVVSGNETYVVRNAECCYCKNFAVNFSCNHIRKLSWVERLMQGCR